MKEHKKLLTLLIILAIFILLIVIAVINDAKNKKVLEENSKVVYAEFTELLKKEENSIIYIGRPTCGYCNLLDPSIKDIKQRYNMDYYYINTDELTNNTVNTILSDLNVTKLSTPYIFIVNGGKVVSEQKGYADYDKLFDFFKTNKMIDEEATLPIKYIGITEYNELIKSNENKIIVVGQSTCGHCVNAKIALNNIATKYNIEINYLNITYLDAEARTTFTSSFDYFGTDTWGTPVMMIVKDNKIVAMYENGFISEDEYVNFLKTKGIIE